MRRFVGSGGELYLASEPTRAAVVLEDCGDGFDWRAADPALRFWLEVSAFAVYEDGEWWPLASRELWLTVGRVGFTRCLSGSVLRAEVTCLPLALAGRAASWQLLVPAVVADSTVIGADHFESRTKVGMPWAGLSGCKLTGLYREQLTHEQVVVRLPQAGGVFVGQGTAAESAIDQSQFTVSFDEKGVVYAIV